MSRTYGYARISSSDQNLERQLIQLKEYIKDNRFIIKDEATGKNFSRKGYKLLVGTDETAPLLSDNDLLIITSLDRLGRNYKEIKEQWNHITETLGANIKVLDMPLLDTTASQCDLDKKFMVDLVFQILSYVAEKEYRIMKERQREGIDAMQIVDGKRISTRTGRPIGREPIKYPSNWDEVYSQWKDGKVTAVKAMKDMELKKATFYNLARKYESSEA